VAEWLIGPGILYRDRLANTRCCDRICLYELLTKSKIFASLAGAITSRYIHACGYFHDGTIFEVSMLLKGTLLLEDRR
jgi:hypothetical protein